MRMVILAAGFGSRLRQETGGRSKVLLEVGGGTILDRAIELAALLGLSPLVVTRREHAEEIARYAEVLVVEESHDIMDTLYFSRSRLTETFCWMGGDMVFSDLGPFRELFAEHLEQGSSSSFFYCRTDRFKPKVQLSPTFRFHLTREGRHELSVPTFMVLEPKLLPDVANPPRGGFVQRAVDRGDLVLAREYSAPLFEIDTPEDLATARRFFTQWP